MINTGRHLLKWASESDGGAKSFAESALAKSRDFLLPFYNMVVRRAFSVARGFVAYHKDCSTSAAQEGGTCPQCGDRNNRRQNKKYIKESLQTDQEPVRPHCKTPIIHIANDPVKARKEIEELRKEKRKLQKDLAKEVYNNNLKVNGSLMNADEVGRVTEATNIMNDHITAELNEKGTEEQRDLWEVH